MQGSTLFDEGVFIPAHQRGIGFVPQEGALFPHLNVADNIAWGLDCSRQEKRRRVAALMEMVSLDGQLATHWPHEISGGQQQRVALARALAQRPSLMLLDEPFSALDTGLRATTRKATADLLAQAGVAAILVTHDQNEALSFASQVAVMRQGRFTRWAPRLRSIRGPPMKPRRCFWAMRWCFLPSFKADGRSARLARC